MAWASDGGTVWEARVGLIGSSSPQPLNDRRTVSGPTLAENAGTHYMAWRGWQIQYYEGGPIGPDNHIWWSQLVNEGTPERSWAPQRPLTDRLTDANPALGSSNGKLYMAWKGADDPFLLWSVHSWSLLLGDRWSSPQALPDTHYWTDKGPALGEHATSVGRRLCMAWKSTYHNNAISWAELTPNGWFDQGVLDDRATSHSPALGSVNGQLHMVWKGAASDTTIWWSRNDEDNWSPQVPLTGRSTDAQPALGLVDGALLMAWKSGSQIQTSYLDGEEWSPPFAISDLRCFSGPALG
jgi:hypothetical protein